MEKLHLALHCCGCLWCNKLHNSGFVWAVTLCQGQWGVRTENKTVGEWSVLFLIVIASCFRPESSFRSLNISSSLRSLLYCCLKWSTTFHSSHVGSPLPPKSLTEQTWVSITLQIYIQKMLGLNLHPVTNYHDWGFSCFSSVCPCKHQDSILN